MHRKLVNRLKELFGKKETLVVLCKIKLPDNTVSVHIVGVTTDQKEAGEMCCEHEFHGNHKHESVAYIDKVNPSFHNWKKT